MKADMKLRTLKEIEIITPMVEDIQNGSKYVWNSLYRELKEHKSNTIRIYQNSRLRGVAEEDINALYDDVLLESIEGSSSKTFDGRKNRNFILFFEHMLKQKAFELMRFLNQEKRVGTFLERSLEADADNEEPKFTNQMDIKAAEKHSDMETLTDFYCILHQYSSKGKKEYLQYQLIILLIESEKYSEEEKRKSILNILPEGTNWETARKRVQRAKKDFESFYKNLSQ